MQSVFIESSVVRYLYMEPTPRIISSVRQLATYKWFEHLEDDFGLVATSQVRSDFQSTGVTKPDDCADLFDDLRMLEINEEIKRVANSVIGNAFLGLSVSAEDFTPHPLNIAAAALNGIEFMLSWECINSHILPKIDGVLRANGYTPPIHKTPAEMLEDRGIPLSS